MKRIILFIGFILFISLSSCEKEEVFNSENSIRDDAGNIFPLDFNPKRIISLAPNITETIYSLNADSLLFGVTDYCDFPPEAKNKDKVGSLLDPNIEKITSLKPDLIFMTTEGNSKYTYLSLKNNGFKVFVANPGDIDGIKRMITGIGILTGKKQTAKKLAERIEDERKYFKLENTGIKPKKCLLIVSMNPLITVNRFTYISEVMELSGLENIYNSELLEYPNISYEDVLLKNPECIVYMCDTTNKTLVMETADAIKSRLGVTDAVKNNRIFPVDENIISRPGTRVMECVKLLRLKVF
ncbi:MAG: ABC transporter substrate-binding protein [Ignavibacteriae bacterium]|nr:ABC transporter substrate-binding protein [Ignavibacteriota bacterium]